ncbi:unnamed protein product [Schistosoma rodhaini]|uniref:Myosin motor domain-containing protein n=1 Tax=Schistosoma rodhaini TaxID=6188 RepID=A0AA85FLS1_9TREM|nr:unnamed protein product [Schistosoma rodhaini]CAH8537713.1 unnamed protein product [Schistosoma rodhaini]
MTGNIIPADLLDLSTPSVSEVVQSLINKYERSEIYTWLGTNILLSINPKSVCPQNYSCDNWDDFNEITDCWRKPHVFSMAEECLYQLSSTQNNQSIIITGTSGSGKTEATKHILHYLTYKSSIKRQKQIAKVETFIEHTLIQSNPVLEALGNAQTQFNENSSRFGKYIRLLYDRNQILVAAKLQIYLLEKPRAVFTSQTLFSSFHVFRWFLESLSKKDQIQFGLIDCHYLVHDNDYDDLMVQKSHSNWSSLLQAFQALNIKDEKLFEFYKLLSVILLLNSVHFISMESCVNIDLHQINSSYLPSNSLCHSSKLNNQQNYHHRHQERQYSDDPAGLASISCDDIQKITMAGKLLGIPDGELLHSFPQQFLTRLVQAGSNSHQSKRMTTYKCACTVSQAREQRDCFVKSLYNSLFHFMVDLINNQLNFDNTEGVVSELGILDLFGFECLDVNSFEQYCINYANERLHQTFMRIAVTNAWVELEEEGLSLQSVNNLLPTDTTTTAASVTNTIDEYKPRLDLSLEKCYNTHTVKAIETNANLLEEVCLLNRVHNVNSSMKLSSTVSSSNQLLDPRELDWIDKIKSVFTTPNCSICLYDDQIVRSPRMTNPKKHTQSTSCHVINKQTISKSSPSTFKTCSKSPCDRFIVKHYGGSVTYSVSGFVTKNLDRLPVHLLTWVKDSCTTTLDGNNSPTITNHNNSSSSLIYLILNHALDTIMKHQMKSSAQIRSPLRQINNNDNQMDHNSYRKLNSSIVNNNSGYDQHNVNNSISPTNNRLNANNTRRLNTVFGNFKSSVDQLLDCLNNHNLYFIRCIRPDLPSGMNCTTINSLSIIDRNYIQDQLLNSGLLAALEVLRSTYYAKYTYKEFINQYRVFWQLNPHPPANQLMETEFSLLNSWYLKLIQLNRSTSKRTQLKLRRETSESTIQQQQQFVLIMLTLGLNLIPINSCCEISVLNKDNSGISNQIAVEFPIIHQFGRTCIHLTKSQFQHLTTLKEFMLNRNVKVIQRFFKRCLKHKVATCRIQHWWRKILNYRKIVSSHPLHSINLVSSLSNDNDTIDRPDNEYTLNSSCHSLPEISSNLPTIIKTQSEEAKKTVQSLLSSPPSPPPPTLPSSGESFNNNWPTYQHHILSRRCLPIINYHHNNNLSNKQSVVLNYLIPYSHKNHILKFFETIEPVKGIFDILL